MAKAKKKPAANKKPAKKQPAARKKPAAKKQPAAKKKHKPTITKKRRSSVKPTQKITPPPPPPAPEQELGGKGAIHVALGAKLTSMRGDEAQERAAIASAIEAFMQLAISDGLPPQTSAYEAMCPEFFWEGDGANPPVYARVPDATHDEIGRWFQFIVEGVRAYDARASASATA
jgi:hypothetical protein